MKLFALFMGFCILFMTAMPCNDKTENALTAQTSHLSSTKDNNHKQATDLCTPFCACNCCATHVIGQGDIPFSIKKKVTTGKPGVHYVQPFTSEQSFSIWQPPRAQNC